MMKVVNIILKKTKINDCMYIHLSKYISLIIGTFNGWYFRYVGFSRFLIMKPIHFLGWQNIKIKKGEKRKNWQNIKIFLAYEYQPMYKYIIAWQRNAWTKSRMAYFVCI